MDLLKIDHNSDKRELFYRSDSSSRRLLDKIPAQHKQKAREVMGLCVALVLGFNIGGGNIRDSLRSGALIHIQRQYCLYVV